MDCVLHMGTRVTLPFRICKRIDRSFLFLGGNFVTLKSEHLLRHLTTRLFHTVSEHPICQTSTMQGKISRQQFFLQRGMMIVHSAREVDWIRLNCFLDKIGLFLDMHGVETSGSGSRWCPPNVLDVLHDTSS